MNLPPLPQSSRSIFQLVFLNLIQGFVTNRQEHALVTDGVVFFSAPIRPALKAMSQDEASAITESINGKRVSAQAYGIYPKIKDVDDCLSEHSNLRSVFFEVHPEVCFWAWNGSEPMQFSKKKKRQDKVNASP